MSPQRRTALRLGGRPAPDPDQARRRARQLEPGLLADSCTREPTSRPPCSRSSPSRSLFVPPTEDTRSVTGRRRTSPLSPSGRSSSSSASASRQSAIAAPRRRGRVRRRPDLVDVRRDRPRARHRRVAARRSRSARRAPLPQRRARSPTPSHFGSDLAGTLAVLAGLLRRRTRASPPATRSRRSSSPAS